MDEILFEALSKYFHALELKMLTRSKLDFD